MPELAELVEPSTTAVVVHEMQRGVVGDLAAPGFRTAVAVGEAGLIPSLAAFLDSARGANVPVIHCAAVFRRNRAGSFVNTPMLSTLMANPDYLISGTPSAEPVPDLWKEGVDVVMERFHGMTSFAGTELDWLLKSFGTTTVIVTGVSLNRGVTGTVIEAVNYGYRVVVPRDGAVGYPAEYAEMVLEHTLDGLAWLSSLDEIAACW